MFPRGCPLSIFGAGELNFRVRDGNGCGLSARVTRVLMRLVSGSAAATGPSVFVFFRLPAVVDENLRP
jgi:hypothetical protein